MAKLTPSGTPRRVTMCTAAEGKTRQSEKDAADINLTIKKYNLQPDELQLGWSGRGEFGDVSGLPSYQQALNDVAVARESWQHVPPDVRLFFGNDVAVMLDAWDQGLHAEVFERIGWLEKKPAEPAVLPPVVAPATP